MSDIKDTTLKLSSNRLYITFGIFLLVIGLKLVFHDLYIDSTREWLLYSIIKDMTSIAAIWIGQGLIFDREGA